MGHRVVGETTQGTERHLSSNRLVLQAGRTLTAVSFEVIVQDYTLRGCISGDKFSRSIAGFSGAMFANSRGGVGADLWVTRDSNSEDPPDRLRVRAGVVQCVTNDCSEKDRDLGTVALGEPTTLLMVWEELNQRFRFRKNDDSPVFVSYSPGEVVRRLQTKALTVVGNAANCDDGSRPVGREQEVGLLRERWAQVEEGLEQVVLLSGEAGIGKSRLVQMLKEYVAAAPRTRLIPCQCWPY
jgi:AAA ATPase domain